MCLSSFAVASILAVKGFKSKFLCACLLIVLTAASTMVVFSRASTERLRSFEDMERSDTYETSFRIFSSSWQSCLLGSGYGSVWPWYLTDRLDGGGLMSPDRVLKSSFGEALYQPHSTMLLLAVELGALGIYTFGYIGFVLGNIVVRARRRNAFVLYAVGIASSGLALFFDLFLFKCWVLSSLWLIYVCGGIKLLNNWDIYYL